MVDQQPRRGGGDPGKPEAWMHYRWSVAFVSFQFHLPASSLNELIHGADLILARCGYSTVADLALLQKAVLIPTPGKDCGKPGQASAGKTI